MNDYILLYRALLVTVQAHMFGIQFLSVMIL